MSSSNKNCSHVVRLCTLPFKSVRSVFISYTLNLSKVTVKTFNVTFQFFDFYFLLLRTKTASD